MHDFVFYKFYSSHIISLLHFEVYSYDYSEAILDLLINIACPVSIKRNYRPYILKYFYQSFWDRDTTVNIRLIRGSHLRDKGDLSPRSIIHYHLHIHILWNNSKHTTQEFLSINLKKKWERDFKKEKNWTVWSWITKRNFTLINYVINWYSRWRSHDEEHVQRIPQWTPFHETATLNHLHVRRWLLMDSASEYILHVYLFLTDGARFEDSQGFKCGSFLVVWL